MGHEERHEYVNKLRKEQGLTPMPSRKKVVVPDKFKLPEGIDVEKFLSMNPGRQRMEYLARFIRQHKIDLKSSRVVKPGVPVGRKPEPRSHPRCGCSSSEACACCSRCVELHCICGLAVRQRRALCQESRACSCILFDPTARCKLCRGCRQPQGFSHCRCVLHQKLLWTKRHPELEVELTEEEEKVACNCFVLANRHGGATVTKEKEEKALEEIERVRRIKRATGFPSSDNIFRTKKISTFLGDEGLEDEWDDGVDDGPGTEILPPRTESVVPRTMVRRMFNPVFHPASYHPLHHDLEKWIRSAIVIPFFTATGAIRKGPSTSSKKRNGKAKRRTRKKKSDIVEAPVAASPPSIRLSVKANPVHGSPAYKLQYATTLEGGQCIKASVGGLDSKAKANATLTQLAKTLEHHYKRSKGLLKRPHPPPPVPGPPPAPRPLPPLDPNNPYDDMYPYVHEHFNRYLQQRWKASIAEYMSWKVAMAQGLEWVPERKQKRKRKSEESLQEESSNKNGRVG
ncbi:hypothetical protein PHYSODRAFT_478970 [Phytophthora sojae]|uniref:Uncharacterized protein n=1 Tax=Phytophthora sojae (strain P6497) TaxID=1094619 RepID=G4YW05_PHYSP|nr:hypothetical protein PHYSODRAFT_478970 [Phytophthora sojae]EGZ23759.1 hypothetical protein PHYSODRAFT_478970 [Phytophthora sojae]|eukprot:XP_009519047.1 hypothetical protein PHYSODRAFT_478970 [Phytophthora sojae]